MGSDSPLKPKRIHVFVNGNPTGRIFFIHPKCRLSWSSIINFIGDLLKPQHGPIKVLRRTDGRSVTAYEELEDNGKYVACGKEPLISLAQGYRTESEIEIRKDLRETSSSEIMNAIGSKLKYLTDTNQMNVITIYVFMNGQRTKPYKISLLKTDLGNWTTILSIVSKQMDVSVKFLYTIFGEKLKDPSEIHHRGFYVALIEGKQFDDVSYLSIFSAKKQRKVRFKQTTQQTASIFKEESLPVQRESGEDKKLVSTSKELDESPAILQEEPLVRSCEVINVNDPTTDSPCIHVTIVQKPFSASKHTPGVPATVCATRPSAKFVLEMLSDRDLNATCQLCKSTQTKAIFCEAVPKGKCMIEVASKKFHIICDEDTIVLPCGTYFSSHRSMKKPCTFPLGNESLSLENIANHIVGIVVDTSEYCVSRAIYGAIHPRGELEEKKEAGENDIQVSSKDKNSCGEIVTNILEESPEKEVTSL
ncbi:uncharacterized protein LOC123311297 [Coccinella septempunctata]|uniref:uncharacterized protein LOC123311297 n=1 Tax=Coccinella septempunctata TaxID=41139 RepID=UPI001D083903|nr:uncharacterized protein LOC123311297 [Coccinella septempunctata]